MKNYEFYVYTENKVIEKGLDIQQAIKLFKKMEFINNKSYKSIGVNCDDTDVELIVKYGDEIKLSNDIEYSDLKNDNLIKINVMNILAEALIEK